MEPHRAPPLQPHHDELARQPLVSHEVIVNLIAATTTRSGLTVQAALDTDPYPKGVKITEAQMQTLNITTHDFHGDWNYTINPAQTGTLIPDEP